MLRNIKLLLAYDGTGYHGWQRQVGRRTLQQTVEEAIGQLTGEPVRLLASGRTDAGVHALGQVANFRTSSTLEVGTIGRALNATLPADVRVRSVEEVPLSFHATYDATAKLYRYVIMDGPVSDPLLSRYAYHWRGRLEARAMAAGAELLRGRHDFGSFQTAGASRGSSVRTVRHITVYRAGPGRIWEPRAGWELAAGSGPAGQMAAADANCVAGGQPAHTSAGRPDLAGTSRPSPVQPAGEQPGRLIFIEIEADGFLYNMVRAIAGTLINVGRGYWVPEAVGNILRARDRRQAGPTAPACGLFLVRVDY